MTSTLSQAWQLVRQTAKEWVDDKVPQLGAALAFYTALSIAPLLVISLGVAALVFGQEAAHGEIQQQMQSLLGKQGADAVEDMIQSANRPEAGVVATVLGVATLLFGASGVFGQLQQSLNTIWEVQPKPGRGVWGIIRDRFLSMSMVLGIAFLLLVSLVISAALTALGTRLDRISESFQWFSQALHFGVSFAVITLLFAMMFKILPDVHIAWRDVWLGAIITAGMFMIGKTAIGLYLGHSSMASSYGVAGSFVVLLVWVYYSAQIFFFGAEFTKEFANLYGTRIVPTAQAEPVTDEARAEQGRPRQVG